MLIKEANLEENSLKNFEAYSKFWLERKKNGQINGRIGRSKPKFSFPQYKKSYPTFVLNFKILGAL